MLVGLSGVNNRKGDDDDEDELEAKKLDELQMLGHWLIQWMLYFAK